MCDLGTNPRRATIGEMADHHSTVGAGDTFLAGVLFGLLCHSADWGVEETLRFAVDLATQKVQREGLAGLAASIAAGIHGRRL